jgi:hypothetical protein
MLRGLGRVAARAGRRRGPRGRQQPRRRRSQTGAAGIIDGPVRKAEGSLQVSTRMFPLSPPPTFRATLRYVQDFNPIPAVGNGYLVSGILQANDTHTPSTIAGGTQALFRDQLFAIYSYCRCFAFTVNVEVIGNSSNPAVIYVGPCITGTPDTSEVLAIQRPGTMDCIVSGYTNQKRIHYAARVTDYFGTNPKVIWNEAFAQPSGADLASGELCYVQVAASSQKLAIGTNALLRIELLQHVQFEQPIQVAAS